MFAFDLPPPAIVRAVEPWEARLSRDLVRHGVPRDILHDVVSEVRRLQGLAGIFQRPVVLQPGIVDLCRYADVPVAAFVPGLVFAFGGGGVSPVVASHANSNSSSTDTNSYTLSISGMVTSGHRVIGVVGRKGSPSLTINSVTCDGVSATALGSQVDNAGSSARFFCAPATGNTTGDVVVSLSGTWLRCGVGVWNALNLLNATSVAAAASDITATSNALDATVAAPDGSAVFAVVYTASGVSWTWTNVSENYDALIDGSDNRHSGGFANVASAASIAVTAQGSGGTSNPVLAVVAMR